jgi:hypothetical protein
VVLETGASQKTERICPLAGRWRAARRRADACPGDEKDEGDAERAYGWKVDLARSIVRHCSMSVCVGIPAKDYEYVPDVSTSNNLV